MTRIRVSAYAPRIVVASSSSRSVSSSPPNHLSSSSAPPSAAALKSTALPDLALDPSFDALLGDMQMRPPAREVREVPDADVTPVSSGFGIRRDEGEEDYADRREERRSPAALLGTKKIGMVVLPEALVKGVQDAIEGE